MTELKPCPFCGSEAMTSWNDKFGWQAFCENDLCFMSQIIATTFETEEQAIQSWNNRTQYDKQESVKKVVRIQNIQTNTYDWGEETEVRADFFCPDCKRLVASGFSVKFPHCPWCGRAVKWNEE